MLTAAQARHKQPCRLASPGRSCRVQTSVRCVSAGHVRRCAYMCFTHPSSTTEASGSGCGDRSAARRPPPSAQRTTALACTACLQQQPSLWQPRHCITGDQSGVAGAAHGPHGRLQHSHLASTAAAALAVSSNHSAHNSPCARLAVLQSCHIAPPAMPVSAGCQSDAHGCKTAACDLATCCRLPLSSWPQCGRSSG
jgi:hypothetical protein